MRTLGQNSVGVLQRTAGDAGGLNRRCRSQAADLPAASRPLKSDASPAECDGYAREKDSRKR
jgi:hypothetical protein